MAIEKYVPSTDKKIHKTSADFIIRNCAREIHIVQYDRTQPIVEVELFNNGRKYFLPNDAIMNLRFGKPDRTFVYKSILGCDETRHIIYFDIDEQMSYLYGKVNPILELIIGDMVAGSSPIPIEIDRNPIQDSDLESNVDYSAITDTAIKGASSASDAAKSAEEAKKYLEEIKSIGGQDGYVTKEYVDNTFVTITYAEANYAMDPIGEYELDNIFNN